MSKPNIDNWFTPEANDEQAPEWEVGKIYYDGQGYTPDEVDAFAAELVTLAATARTNAQNEDRTDKDWWEADYRTLDAAGNVVKQGTQEVIADDADQARYYALSGLDARTLAESGQGSVVIDAVRKI